MINLLLEETVNVIDWSIVGLSVAVMAAMAVVLGVLIMLISKYCEVKTDPKIEEVYSKLPHANCGGCGQAGCSEFAKALCEGKAEISSCGQLDKEHKIEISNILGLGLEGTEPTVCVVACAGGNSCQDKYGYQGYGNCVSQNLLADGRKACETGCMGAGSCVDACPYLCIECKDGYAQINPDLCRSCGICVKTCPKHLIKRVPKSAEYYVACSTECRGKDVMSKCKSGCIACGICEKNCPSGAIHLVNNVPIIDYSKCTNCGTCAAKCPRKVIKTIDKH